LHAPSSLGTRWNPRQTTISLNLLLLLIAFFIPAHCLRAQGNPAPPCTAADLDTSFRFGNYPPSTYIVAVLSRNISGHLCVLANHTAPTFYDQRAQLPVGVNLDPASANSPSTLLHPDATAHQTIRWSTSAPAGAPDCQKASVLNVPANNDTRHPAQLVAPSLLPTICSQVAVDGYALGPTYGDDDSQPSRYQPRDAAIHLSSGIAIYHPGESFVLRAESAAPSPGPLGRASARCPTFFLRQRTFEGATRVEEFHTPQIRCIQTMGSGASQPFVTTTFDAVAPIQGNTLGDAALQIFQLSGSLGDALLNFAESNPITLHITDASAVPAQHSNSSAFDPASASAEPYTGWQTSFTLTDTAFGKKSALLDQSTHLEWLRLSATRNKSEETLRRTMSPHKALDGWRFATDEEVATFFRHFTGSFTGRSNDPAIESELQRLMGGPLGNSKNTAGGSARSFTYGRIEGYYAPTSGFADASAPRFQYHYASIMEETRDDGQVTATVDPARTGRADGDRTSPDTGTFVVREH